MVAVHPNTLRPGQDESSRARALMPRNLHAFRELDGGASEDGTTVTQSIPE